MSALELRAVRFPKGPLEALPPFDLSLERGRCTLAFGHGVKRLDRKSTRLNSSH